MKALGTILLLALAAAQSLADLPGSLYIQNPRTGQGYYGTVESSVFVVRPRGLYMQCDFTLTFSARGAGFAAAETVEVQSAFNLPEAATITDLWLQIGADSSRGLILDRNTASTTYEGIVRRRRDPCLLLKEATLKESLTGVSYARYTMKIYPMLGSGSRTVRLTWLMPAEWRDSGVRLALPRWMFAMSNTSTQETRLLVAPSRDLVSPRLLELPDLTMSVPPDSAGWAALTISSTSLASLRDLTLALDWKTPPAVSFSGINVKGEQFYQAAVFPRTLFPSVQARKVAVLVDLDEAQAWTNKQDMVSSLQAFLKSTLGPNDSVNVLYSAAAGVHWKWGGWSPATPERVDYAAAWLKELSLVKAPSLAEMLKTAVEYVRSTGEEGVILLLSSSTGYNRPTAADSALAFLKPLLTRGTPISIADLTTPYAVYSEPHAGSNYSYNNEYFNSEVSGLTGGKYIRRTDIAQGSLPAMLAALDRSLQNTPEAFEVYIAPSGGMTYARSDPFGTSDGTPAGLASAFMQTGKFAGHAPVTLTAAMLYQGTVYSRTFTIDAVEPADTTLRQLWAGASVRDLEAAIPSYYYGSYYGSYPAELIDLSVSERVLSRATAFLALEPGDTLRYCQTCGNARWDITGLKEKKPPVLTDSLIQVYPNPFNMSTNIRVRLPGGVKPGEAKLRIVNTLGQVVKELDAALLSDEAMHILVWDGRNSHGAPVSSGVYFFLMTSPRGTIGTRLLLTK